MRGGLRRSILYASLGVAISLGAATARADDGKIAQASDFFDSGAQAYKAGQYLVAAEAFLKANEIAPNPALLFSAAQAYRKQYLVEPSADVLRRGVALYRDYLRADPQAKRREDAMQALAVLVPLEATLAPPKDAEGTATKEPEPRTRLLLSTPVDGAEISVDNGAFHPSPMVAKVEPGPHQVHIRAKGYEDAQLTVKAEANELIPHHIPLSPKPARLRVTGTAGARVSVDGQVRATVPMATPIEISPGAHFIAVTANGREPYSRQIDADRDATIDLPANLPQTRQRIAAWSVLSAGAATAVASGVLTGLMLGRQGEATSLRDQRAMTPLSPDERDRYNRAVAARDDFARAAGVTGGAAALMIAAGLGLFAFDRPEVAPPSNDRGQSPTRPTPRADFDVGLLSVRARISF